MRVIIVPNEILIDAVNVLRISVKAIVTELMLHI